MASKKKTAPASKRIADAAAKVSELKAEVTAAAETARAAAAAASGGVNLWKWAAIALLCLWGFSGVKGCVQEKFAGWKESVIQRLVPAPPSPFRDRERRTRPDRNDGDNDGGIRWKFIRGVEGAGSLASWVKKNVPAGVSVSSVYDVADAFYDAADAIAASPAIDTPAEAVAAVRQRLAFAADAGWAGFLAGLDRQANTYGVESIADVIAFYYAVGTALYDSAGVKAAGPESPEAVSAASEPSAEPEPGQEPPSDPAALPEPAEPDASEPAPEPAAKECPSGTCPNAAPRAGYGYNYGWRWY